jgi:hypothetical protein
MVKKWASLSAILFVHESPRNGKAIQPKKKQQQTTENGDHQGEVKGTEKARGGRF